MIEINSFVLRGRAVVLDKIVMRNILIVSFKIDRFLKTIKGFKVKGELRHGSKKFSQAEINSVEERGGNLGFELPWKLPKGKYTIIIKLLNKQDKLVDSLTETYDYTLFDRIYNKGVRKKKKPRYAQVEHQEPTRPLPINPQDKEKGYLTFQRHYLRRVYPNTVPQKSELTQKLSVTCARGEFEPVTFSIYPLQDLGQVSISVTDLVRGKKARIPKKEITIRVVKMLPERINSRYSGDYRMAPRLLEKKSRVMISQKETTCFWLTLRVKEEVRSGDYLGQIYLRPTKGKPSQIKLHLKVLPFKLASPPHIDFAMLMTYAFYELQGDWSEKEKALIRKSGYKIYQDFKDHGMTTVFPHCYFYFKRKTNGQLNLDDLKACLKAAKGAGFRGPIYWYMGHLIQASKHKHPGNVRNYDPGIHLERAKEVAKCVQRMCHKNDWPEVVFQPIDEPSGAHEPADEVRIGIAREMVRAMKEVPGVKVLVVGGIGAGLLDQEYKLDITIEGSHRHFRDIQKIKKQGTKFWIYSNGAVRCHNPAYSRYMYGFHPWKWRVDGMCSWTYQVTQGINGEPFTGSALAGDVMVAFPSPDGPIPTPLWEAVREGIDDYKYIYQLESLIKKGKKIGLPEAGKAERELEKIRKSVVKGPGPREGEYHAWKPEVFDKKRAKVAALILSLREKMRRKEEK